MQRAQTRLRRRGWRLVLAIMALVLAMLLSGCGAAGSASTPSASGTSTSGVSTLLPVHIRVELDRASFNTPALMCTAFLVVDTIPASVGPSRWNTPDGARPNMQPAALQQAGYTIFTPLALRQVHILHDERTQPTQGYMMLGGRVGQDSVLYDGYPMAQAGQRAIIVFIPGIDRSTHTNTQAQLILNDVFPIDAQGRVILQPQTVEQGKISQQEVTIPLAQFTDDLLHCS